MDGVDGSEGEVFGRYRLLDVLRSGSTGTVYKAHDTMMSRDVAIKVLLPELVAEPGYQERFRREVAIAARLNDPNIIPIYEAGEIDGRLYLVMPAVVDGITVKDLLGRDGPNAPVGGGAGDRAGRLRAGSRPRGRAGARRCEGLELVGRRRIRVPD